jgi:hypothetical protein
MNLEEMRYTELVLTKKQGFRFEAVFLLGTDILLGMFYQRLLPLTGSLVQFGGYCTGEKYCPWVRAATG